MPVHFRHFHSCPHAIARLGGFSAEIFSLEFVFNPLRQSICPLDKTYGLISAPRNRLRDAHF